MSSLDTVEDAIMYIQSGNVRVMLRSEVSGNSYKYWVRENSNGKAFLVYLVGASGELGYMGSISNGDFKRTDKSRVSSSAPAFRAFDWVWKKLAQYQMPEGVRIEDVPQ